MPLISGRLAAPLDGDLFRIAPVLDAKADASSLDRLKVFGVAGHQRQTEPDGNGGDQTIRKLDDRALLAGGGLDAGGLQVVGGYRCDLLVLVQPLQSFLQLSGCAFEFKPVNDFIHGDAGEREYAVLPRVVGGSPDNDPVIPFKVFGKDIGIEQSFRHPLERGRRAGRATSFFVGDMDNLIDQGRIIRAAE